MAQDRTIDWPKYNEAIPIACLGEPNRALSKKNQLRWGSAGSISYNPEKGTFFDHEAGEGGGLVDLMKREWGADWQDILLSKHILDREDEAALARGRGRNGARANGQDYPDDYAGGERIGVDDHAGAPAASGGAILGADGAPLSHKPKVTRRYDYRDREGNLVYQVERKEWIKEGKRRKTFTQRRPSPNGGWINNLSGVEHQLYRLPELTDVQPGEDLLFIAEGEKDVDRLAAEGLVATTNSGGAKTWTEEHAKALAGHDVVVLIDNDDAGRARLAKIGPSLVKHCKSVRALDLAEFWDDIGEKEDVSDWLDRGGGTAIKLATIAARLPEWRPSPPASKFGALRIQDLLKPGPQHEFLIKGVLTRGEVSMLVGPSGSGKSFLATDMALSVAQGIPFVGRRVLQGGVVYIAGEGGRGLKKRLMAYVQHHGIDPANSTIPFVLLTLPIDLHSNDSDMNALIAEVMQHAATFNCPLELVVIDTLSAATPGANENASEDMTRVLSRIGKIKDAVGAAVQLVHHMNAAGTKARGHSSIFANVDSVIECVKNDSEKDANGRPKRISRLTKQKDGDDGTRWEFVLRQVTIGRDADGDPITSCVVDYPADQAQPESTEPGDMVDNRARLKPRLEVAFRALVAALRAKGRRPPAHIPAPISAECVTLADWRDEYMRLDKNEDDTDEEKHKDRIKKRREYAVPLLLRAGLVQVDGDWVWRTGRKVFGIDRPERPAAAGPSAEPDSPLMSDDDKELPF